MKWSTALTFAAAMFASSQRVAGGDKPPAGRQLQFNLRVFEGNPFCSRGAGTLKILAEPRLVTLEDRPFSFICGSEIAVSKDASGVQFVQAGLRIDGKPGTIKDGKVRLDVTTSNTRVEEGTEAHKQVHTERTRKIIMMQLGAVVMFRWGKGSADRQRWVELSVEAVKP
jgi:hypothetical protein